MKNIAIIAVVLISLIASGFSLYVRIANPDMTETRLALTYWREYAGIAVAFLAAVVWVKRTK